MTRKRKRKNIFFSKLNALLRVPKNALMRMLLVLFTAKTVTNVAPLKIINLKLRTKN